jgi:Zn-dependent M28 family amino/carboxypeptidase
MGLRQSFSQFLVDEGVLATVEVSSRDNALVRVSGGGSREVDGNPGVTALVMAVEHYNWVVRLLEEHKQDVKIELNIGADFHDEDLKGYNVIADIPGTEKPEEIVLIGGHIDSWHTGTGATDNAAGCAISMEAVRILKALGVQPRRTIRVGLWGGEEQGFLGSTAYVNAHLAERKPTEENEDSNIPSYMRRNRGPLELKSGHENFSVYFNYDNGGGKIRGIYAQENSTIKPIFEAWLEPLADLGAETVTLRNTGGTDHLPFDRVGLPGFQFIQDPLDYSSRTHHSNVDVLDHLRREDLVQASVVMATFAYHAAMRDDLMPRKPMPDPESSR